MVQFVTEADFTDTARFISGVGRKYGSCSGSCHHYMTA